MKKNWLLSIILCLPVFIFYLCHYSSAYFNPEVIPTGFIQIDQASYISNAKEYAERGGFSLQYPLPFSTDYDNNNIYFQPQIFVLGQIMRFIPIDPGILFMLFGFLFSVLSVRICIEIYNEYIIPKSTKLDWLGPLFFIWGGGVLFLLGFSYNIVLGKDIAEAFDKSFLLDPGNGWWFLNLGRNFIYPMEAYYHFLFFCIVYFVYKKRYFLGLGILGILMISHPFTGTAALLIFSSWVLLEQFYVKQFAFSKRILVSLIILFMFNFAYYLLYLPSNTEHQILMDQWALDWSMTAVNFIPAYFLVGLFVLFTFSTPKKLLVFIHSPFNRFLVIWALVNFLLENHEFAVSPHQPLHFSRGYTWAALFLIGYSSVKKSIAAFLKKRKNLWTMGVYLGLSLILLSDNIVWFTKFGYEQAQKEDSRSIKLAKSEAEILNYLGTLKSEKRILLSLNKKISYLSTVYSDFRPYFGHKFNSTFPLEKITNQNNFFNNGLVSEDLKGQKTIIIYQLENMPIPLEDSIEIFRNHQFSIHLVDL